MSPAAFCECSSEIWGGTYITIAGTDECGYTTTPTVTWYLNAQICTIGLYASSLGAVKPTATGKYVFTEIDIPTSGAGATVYGCTSNVTRQADSVMATYCAGFNIPLITPLPARQEPHRRTRNPLLQHRCRSQRRVLPRQPQRLQSRSHFPRSRRRRLLRSRLPRRIRLPRSHRPEIHFEYDRLQSDIPLQQSPKYRRRQPGS